VEGKVRRHGRVGGCPPQSAWGENRQLKKIVIEDCPEAEIIQNDEVAGF
jgi:hypothetical protein